MSASCDQHFFSLSVTNAHNLSVNRCSPSILDVVKSRWSCSKDLVEPVYSLGIIVVAGIICAFRHISRAEVLDPEVRNAIREPYDTAFQFLKPSDKFFTTFGMPNFHVLEIENVPKLPPQIAQALVRLHPSVLFCAPSDKPSVPALRLITQGWEKLL